MTVLMPATVGGFVYLPPALLEAADNEAELLLVVASAEIELGRGN